MNCVDCGKELPSGISPMVQTEAGHFATSSFRCVSCLRLSQNARQAKTVTLEDRVAKLEKGLDAVEEIFTKLLAEYTPSSFKTPEEQANDWPTIPGWVWLNDEEN